MARHFEINRHTAKDAIKLWHEQYGFRKMRLADGSDSGEISRQLRDLKRPTKAQVDKIIGSDGWTNIFCGCCHEYKPKVVIFGEDYESTFVCEDCLRAALKRLLTEK